MELKEFTKYDWDAWAGAERFPDGSESLIGSTEDRVVIADATGIHLEFLADESFYTFETQNAKLVIKLLVSLDTVTPEELLAVGFRKIN